MKKVWFVICFGIIVIAGFMLLGKKNFGFPESLDYIPESNQLLVISGRTKEIAVISTLNFRLKHRIILDNQPTGITHSKSGQFIYVSVGVGNGYIYIIRNNDKKIINKINVGHSPVAPVISSDSKLLYVCNRFANTISIVDLARSEKIFEIPVPREPVCQVLSADNKFLFVGNHLPSQPSNQPYVASLITVISTDKQQVVRNIRLPNGSTGVKRVALSFDGKYVYFTHLVGRYELPLTQIEHGWINNNVLSIIDVANQKLVNTVSLDKSSEGSANPWAVQCSPDNSEIFITHSGTNELSIIDNSATLQKNPVLDTVNSLSLNFDLTGFSKKKIKLEGLGPRDLAIIDDSLLCISNFFSSSLEVFNFKKQKPHTRPIKFNKNHTPDKIEAGEIYFNSGNICFQKWQSCASCHPDGRADGLNWDLLNDGTGNPKNARSLLLSHMTPPVMSTGMRANAETAVRSGIHFILFNDTEEDVPEAIDAYLKSMTPVPSPFLIDGKLSESAKRGEKLFFSSETGCFNCHPKPYYTDLKLHKVGTNDSIDFKVEQDKYFPQESFDTPTLIEAWRTGPYLHNGKYFTLKEAITVGNHSGLRGKTSSLSDAEINDLVSFILSL